jgi:hypothetical protein
MLRICRVLASYISTMQGRSNPVVGRRERKMLACIACSTKDGGEDGGRAAATHNGRDAGKSLTSQVYMSCRVAASIRTFT